MSLMKGSRPVFSSISGRSHLRAAARMHLYYTQNHMIIRHLKKLCTWILLLVAVLFTSLLILPYLRQVIRPVTREEVQSRYGLSSMIQASPFFDGTNAPSFAMFFKKVKLDYPDWVGNPRSANPFPGVLPKNRVYGRVLELPMGFCALDFASTPLMWDTRPCADGKIPVLFMDGHSRLLSVTELEQAIETVRSHGGALWLGTSPLPPRGH